MVSGYPRSGRALSSTPVIRHNVTSGVREPTEGKRSMDALARQRSSTRRTNRRRGKAARSV